MQDNAATIAEFTQQRQTAFDEELQRWIKSGQINFETEQHSAKDPALEEVLGKNEVAIESHVAGNIWKVMVKPGQHVNEGDPVVILESMKMEIEVVASEPGTIQSIIKHEGNQVTAGQRLLVMKLD